MLTAGYKGFLKVVKIKSMLLLLLHRLKYINDFMGSNPAWDMNFSLILEMCQELPVSYWYLEYSFLALLTFRTEDFLNSFISPINPLENSP